MTNLECTLSSRNLCKGKVLMDYVKRRWKAGQKFDFVGFAGDGINDFCPMLRLRPGDLACGRKDFSIMSFIDQKRGEKILLKADVLFWETGDEIVDAVAKKLSANGHGDRVNHVLN